MEYKVQATGLAETHSADQVRDAFARVFNLEPAKAAKALSRLPLVIKEGLDAEQAQKYSRRLEAIGLRVEVLPMLEVAASTAPVSAPVAVAPVVPVAAAPANSEIELQLVPISAPKSETTEPGAEPTPTAVRKGPAPAGLEFRIEGRPDYAFLSVQIPANQTIKVEASAMATMDTHLKMKTRMRGGLSRLLTGESIFVNEFTAEGAPGEIGIAPAAPGDLGHVLLNDDVIYLQNSAFVACGTEVKLESKWQGLVKGFFSGESLFLIRASGQGDLWFNTYGGMIELDIEGDYVVDTGNIVAFTDGLDYRISKIGGYKSLFFSGEGLVCRFSGKGKVWIQTRAAEAFASWAHQFRPTKDKD